MNDFDAVIFDMDGTLLDSMQYWRKANVDFLSARGLTAPEEIRADLMSTSNRVAAQLYAKELGTGMTTEQILAEYRERMAVYYQTEVLPKPHVREYLDHLLARGVKLCVGTASPWALATAALERHGLLNRFEFVVSAFDTKMKKEEPGFYQAIADRLGVPYARCVMFEDALYAMEGAKAAGMLVFAIADPIQKKSEMEIRAISDCFIRDFAELII